MTATPLNLQDVNARPSPCARCGTIFRVALPSEFRDRRDLALLARSNGARFIQILKEIVRCELTDAKGVLHHVTKRSRECHQCGAPLPIGELVDCRRCGALNLQLDIQGPAVPCPACGFIVFVGTYGSYDVCPVCGWEDDGVQLANPTSSGGANRESLLDAQVKALTAAPLGTEHATYERSSRWRPLTEPEIQAYRVLAVRASWHSAGVTDEADAYWARNGA